jgi:DNA-binding SARP family transcriptional activator/Tfp pilus assembly protein PilF
MITVQLLGGACLLSGDSPVSGPPAQRHRIALLALIAAAWPQPLSRDRAMAMLWPERDLPGARRLLNLAVHVLRATLGEDAIASTGDGLLLNPSRVSCDLHELRTAIEADASERIVRLYTAPLLDGFHLDDSSEFGYWLDERRSELTQAYIGALLAISERQDQAGDVQGRIRTCRRLVAADSHSGAYAQALMRALDAAGDRAGAIQHASEYARRIGADLDLEPDAEVVGLAEQLRKAPPRRMPATYATVRTRVPSVGVLPFLNLSAGAENEYFADGITEDVIAHLSKIRALKVISRTSVMPFKQRQQTLKEIGTRLGATSLLDGSVRRSGDRVRIVAKLIDVAREWFIKYSPESFTRAIDHYERAIARDKTFALAYANLAMAHIELAEMGVIAPDIVYQRAAEAAANALRLDPDLDAAHCTMGYLKMVREFEWSGAERDFRRALELSPSSADTYALYGRLCAGLARYDEAMALQQRAHELDPLAQRMDLLTTMLRVGRYDQAVIAAEAAVELDPDYDRARATLGWAYFLSGRKAEGLAELERAVAVAPENTLWLGQLGQAYAMAGDVEKARGTLRELEQRTRSAYVSPYHFAYVYIGLGDFEQAMDLLERAVAERTGPAYSIKGSFLLTPLHTHRRFHALLRQMRLE